MNQCQPGLGYWVNVTAAGELWYPGFNPSGMLRPATMATSSPFAGPRWFSVYSVAPTLDGKPLQSGTNLEFRSDEGDVVGSAMLTGGRLRFTPVYEKSAGWPLVTIEENNLVQVWVDGRRAYPDILRPGLYERVELPALKSDQDAADREQQGCPHRGGRCPHHAGPREQ